MWNCLQQKKMILSNCDGILPSSIFCCRFIAVLQLICVNHDLRELVKIESLWFFLYRIHTFLNFSVLKPFGCKTASVRKNIDSEEMICCRTSSLSPGCNFCPGIKCISSWVHNEVINCAIWHIWDNISTESRKRSRVYRYFFPCQLNSCLYVGCRSHWHQSPKNCH